MRMTASWFGCWTHRIQGCGAIDLRARKAGSPLIVIPIASSVPPCSELSRYGLASPKLVERLVRRPTLTAPARAGFANTAGRDEETGFPGRTKKPMKKAEKEIAVLKPLDNKKPIQGASGSHREAESTDASERGGLPRISDEGPVMGLERRRWV